MREQFVKDMKVLFPSKGSGNETEAFLIHSLVLVVPPFEAVLHC